MKSAPDNSSPAQHADYERLAKFSHRATIRNAIVAALVPIYGRDNVDHFTDDPWRIGVCFEDGDLVELHIDGGGADG